MSTLGRVTCHCDECALCKRRQKERARQRARNAENGVWRLDPEPIRAAIMRDALAEWNSWEGSLYLPPGRYPGLKLLERMTGIGERSLRRVLEEVQYVSIAYADRYCIATGRHLSSLYPELYDFEMPEMLA